LGGGQSWADTALTVSGLNVDEPKFLSLRTLRVELKEQKCDIC